MRRYPPFASSLISTIVLARSSPPQAKQSLPDPRR
jgi:hypothetical protein